MRDWIQRLSDRGEFALVISLCFAYYIATSLAVLFLRIRTYDLTTGRALRGILVEVAILATAAWILRIREFSLARLTRKPTWATTLGGIPLFVGYMLLYWSASIAVLLAFPATAEIAITKIVPKAPFAVMALLIVVNSVFEEVAVTGYVVSKLAPQGVALAITASTLLRLTYHLYQGPRGALSVIPLGILFAAVYWRTRSLWPLMVAHTIANFVALGYSEE